MSFNLDEQSYEIEDELKIRKTLEEHTNWSFEFTKNSQYAPDLQLHDWGSQPTAPGDRELTGFVELERAHADSDWQTGDLPDSWSTVNFLKRKLYRWDFDANEWDGLKEGFTQTVYLKFNHRMDNCFCASLERIRADGNEFAYNGGGRQNEFFALHPESSSVRHGIHDCVQYIETHLSQVEKRQSTLTSILEQTDD